MYMWATLSPKACRDCKAPECLASDGQLSLTQPWIQWSMEPACWAGCRTVAPPGSLLHQTYWWTSSSWECLSPPCTSQHSLRSQLSHSYTK